MTTTIDVTEVCELQDRLDEINRLPFNEIMWTQNGIPISIHPEVLADWRFIGLSNSMFITAEFYKTQREEVLK